MVEDVRVEPVDVEPVDVARALADPRTYDEAILRIFDKRRQRGQAFTEIQPGVTYFDTATGRRTLSRALSRSVAAGTYRPQPVDLWFLESKGKTRAAHMPRFTDHVIGSALYQLLSRNARCYGLPGVYSYLPGLTNTAAMRALAAFVRAHRHRFGPGGPPLYVLQSDFDHYGDGLPVGPDAPWWPLLREVSGLGSPNQVLPQRFWDLICELIRPVVRDSEGAEFNRVHGVPMGTPLVPLLSNLAVVPMDRAVLGVEGIFYARYNDDFLLAHHDLDALHEADRRIDEVLAGLGVRRKLTKEIRTALSPTGMPADRDPAYLGRNRIDCLGLSVSYAGTMTVGPHRLSRFMTRVSTRIDGSASAVRAMPVAQRAGHIVAAANVMLDVGSPFAVPGLSALLDTTTDRGVLKDLDYRIARKIVQSATGRPGVRGFRLIRPATLYREMGLTSLVRLRNLR
ncbi:MAG: hypothetical protein KIH64_004665 [Mycobacterium sp.]|nr:hypothetical protein [Mycobacterium sp.]